MLYRFLFLIEQKAGQSAEHYHQDGTNLKLPGSDKSDKEDEYAYDELILVRLEAAKVFGCH